MIDQRCETCRWWAPPEFDPQWPGAPESIGWGVCRRLTDWHYAEGELAALEDGALFTSARFGCVLWEPHDTEGTA